MICIIGSETVIETLDHKKIEHEGSKSAKEEAGAKDEADGGEVEGENPGGRQSKEAANGNVADHRLQGNEVGLAKCVEDTGEEVAKHESNVEGEQEEHKADIVLWLGDLKNRCEDKMPARDRGEPEGSNGQGEEEERSQNSTVWLLFR